MASEPQQDILTLLTLLTSVQKLRLLLSIRAVLTGAERHVHRRLAGTEGSKGNLNRRKQSSIAATTDDQKETANERE
jgi:hypothetical protein